VWLVLPLWVVAALVGMRSLLNYQVGAGAAAQAPATWPATSSVPRSATRPLVLLLAHPRCPCTRATVSELERIEAQTGGQLPVVVLFVLPAGREPQWVHTDLWQSAARIPGVRVVIDRGGVEARRFGVSTSGQTLFYDEHGTLRFAGGITPGRGHAGDNAGADAVVALARHEDVALASTPVYGCALSRTHGTTEGARTCPK
jgi:hypothetical protein